MKVGLENIFFLITFLFPFLEPLLFYCLKLEIKSFLDNGFHKHSLLPYLVISNKFQTPIQLAEIIYHPLPCLPYPTKKRKKKKKGSANM